MQRLLQFMSPSVEPDTLNEVDRISLNSIRMISRFALLFEICAVFALLISIGGRVDENATVSLVSLSFSILLCTLGWVLSGRMLSGEAISHEKFFVFKIFFYLAFTTTAILFDFRNYRAGNQMVTFYIVNLIMICFIVFRPWIATILVSCSYLALLLAIFSFDGAAHIQPLNLGLLALASIASSAVRYHSLISVSSHAVRLAESNVALENSSRHDGLTGLLNRLALEDDAHRMTGGPVTVYMMDINYFKEINDQYGHMAGDEILRETSRKLDQLYPGGRRYRYGGDEFLVVTSHPPEVNHQPDTYEFIQEKYGVKVLLSIGFARGNPADYREFYELISQADKALYLVKRRTHSVQFGGHDRRRAEA